MVGALERRAFTSKSLYGRSQVKINTKTNPNDISKIYKAGGLDGFEGMFKYSAANALVGTALSFMGPSSILGIKLQNPEGFPGAEYDNSSGIQTAGRLTAAWLYMAVAGVEINLGDRYTYYLKGTDKDEWEDTLFANAGLALPMGGMIPLISYLHTWKSAPSTSAGDTSTLTGSSSGGSSSGVTSEGSYKSAGSGSDYPMSYAPSTGTNSYFSSANSSTGNAGLLGVNTSNLLLLTLNQYKLGINPSKSPTNTLPVTLVNAGTNLVDGNYSNVSILGVSADQNPQSTAQASFTVAGGSIVADSFQIVRKGTYLALPETQPNSGIYALILDVFTTGIAQPPAAGTASVLNTINTLPMIAVDSSRTGSPLTSQQIQRIQSVSVPLNSQAPGVIYPIYNNELASPEVV
jgi:hypothetical protein